VGGACWGNVDILATEIIFVGGDCLLLLQRYIDRPTREFVSPESKDWMSLWGHQPAGPDFAAVSPMCDLAVNAKTKKGKKQSPSLHFLIYHNRSRRPCFLGIKGCRVGGIRFYLERVVIFPASPGPERWRDEGTISPREVQISFLSILA